MLTEGDKREGSVRIGLAEKFLQEDRVESGRGEDGLKYFKVGGRRKGYKDRC